LELDDLTSPPPVATDKLDALRTVVREVRDLEAENMSLQERMDENKKRITLLTTKHLVDLFGQAQVTSISIEAEGNYPPYKADRVPYYKASIAAEWPEDKQAAAFRELDAHGGGDLVRTQIIIELPRGQRARARQLEERLTKAGYSFSRRLSVPWNTLTAWWRELHEKRPNDPKPRAEVIGAIAGEVVRLTPVRSK
jgi:hypothetical protein